MAPAVEQVASAPPSLFITIVASAFGGALITSGVTIWAKFADSKAEHRKWLREEKLSSYVDFIRMADHVYYALNGKVKPDDHSKFMGEITMAVTRIDLLASADVAQKSREIRDSATADKDTANHGAYFERIRDLTKLMRKDLLPTTNKE